MNNHWQSIETAPKDGTPIIGLYEEGEALTVWSDRPVCILGPTAYWPPGWATYGDDVQQNLPMDPPTHWRTDE